ncbi:MAG: RNA-directed DNA polymerase [Pseudomonadota bacterium]
MIKLSEKMLDWALAHVEQYGDTNIFPVPFEFLAIRHVWDTEVRPFLRSQDIMNWQTRPYRRCLTPKHRYGFRIATQLDPLDTLVFTALVGEIGADIEAVRLPPEKKIAFSNRFKPSESGQMYDPEWTYQRFQDYSTELCALPKYKYIVLADIADFFPRIYSHPLENALEDCTKRKEHVAAIKKLLKSWSFTISVGIPVGIQISMLLAELVLDDVDRGLIDEGAKFCRYVDDFRIFCETEQEAHMQLALLASILYENHALTLQQHKTMILPVATFHNRFLKSEKSTELGSLSTRLHNILKEIGVSDFYQRIEYKDLDSDKQKKVDGLNLVAILKEQIARDDIDIPLTRFVLRRLSQFDDEEGVKFVLKSIDRLYPVFTDVIRYVQDLRTLEASRRHTLGKMLLRLLDGSLVGHLDFHRLWILNTFTKNMEWDNEDMFAALFKKHTDSFSSRELILALGRAHRTSWFKTRKREIDAFEPWQKRAFIAAASCLPGDEFRHWYKSILAHLDPLEQYIGKWVKDNAF